jgi:hypothetical protein
MDAGTKMRRKMFGIEGRYFVTIECAANLTDDERIKLEAWFETEVEYLQGRHRGDTGE